MNSKDMEYLGKWAFCDTAGRTFLSLDKLTGKLVGVQATGPAPSQRFNAYGDRSTGFWLQADNGKYVTYSSDGYSATEERSGEPALFVLISSGSAVRLVEQASGMDYDVNMSGGSVGRVSTTNPPPTTLFHQLSVTPGLEQIQQDLVIHSADLSWADLSSADLSNIDFSGSNLTGANLTGCNLSGASMTGEETILTNAVFANARMKSAIMPNVNASGADFRNAVMKYAVLSDANLRGSNFTGADLSSASAEGADWTGAYMTNANLHGTILIGSVLANANLTKANLTQASVDRLRIPGATLQGAKLDKLDLSTAEFDCHTDFKGASMQKVRLNNCTLRGVTFDSADLTGSVLDGCDLTNANFSDANLTNALLRNGVKLFGAMMSNATLLGADLTGAQLGAKQEAFTLNASLASDLDNGAITDGIRQAFKKAGHSLSEAALLKVRISGRDWVIRDDNTVYTITRSGNSLKVWMYTSSTNAAVLAGAYMPNAILTDANLYAVNMSGVNWYGERAKADNADLEEADLSNANLSGMDFSQARMYGCSLDSAILIETTLNGAYLTHSINQKQASLAYANIQGASFQQARLQNAVMTNAAVSLNEGPFFSLSSSYAADLDNQTISAALRAQFQTNHHPLETNASVDTVVSGSQWTIKNGANSCYPIYSIIKLGTCLDVSGGPIGVHLFNLPQTMTAELDAMTIGENMKEAFSDSGYPLIPSAEIDRVIIKGRKWHMTNISSDTSKLQKGYVEFYVISYPDKLHVYGSVLMINRPDETHTMEQVRFELATTQLTQDIMDDSTTCPNGRNLGQNLIQKKTWEEMMTAKTPPKPPACVPNPCTFCPSEKYVNESGGS